MMHQAAGRAMTISAVLLAKSLELAALLTGK